jgi:hypothetical protein
LFPELGIGSHGEPTERTPSSGSASIGRLFGSFFHPDDLDPRAAV